jgi:hypothetical protein
MPPNARGLAAHLVMSRTLLSLRHVLRCPVEGSRCAVFETGSGECVTLFWGDGFAGVLAGVATDSASLIDPTGNP